MKQIISAGLALCLAAGPVSGAGQPVDERSQDRARVSESRPVDARVLRVRLDGVIDLIIRQGAVAQLVLNGERAAIDRTSTEQNGDTLLIDNDEHVRRDRDGKERKGGINFSSSRTLRAELTLPRLRSLSSDSVGSTEVFGFSGEEIDLSLDGAGAMKVVSDYKVVKASLGGLGGLDAEKFQADTVNLDMSGLGNASVLARQNAVLNLSGMGSVTVYGKPERRSVSIDGLGKVSWK